MSEPSRTERDLEFSARARIVADVPLLDLFRALFSRLASGRSLPESPRREAKNKYNWGADQSYFTAEGDGLLIAEQCFGGVPGDGIDVVFELTVGNDVLITVAQGRDYSQPTLTFHVSATAETIEAATGALVETARTFRLKPSAQ